MNSLVMHELSHKEECVPMESNIEHGSMTSSVDNIIINRHTNNAASSIVLLWSFSQYIYLALYKALKHTV